MSVYYLYNRYYDVFLTCMLIHLCWFACVFTTCVFITCVFITCVFIICVFITCVFITCVFITCVFIICVFITCGLGLWCLMPLSTIFQLYRGGQFYWWRKPEYLEKTIDPPRKSLTLITCLLIHLCVNLHVYL